MTMRHLSLTVLSAFIRRLQDFFCVAWQGADWDGKAASVSTPWKPCPSELRYAPKDVSLLNQSSVPLSTVSMSWFARHSTLWSA
jgi:hypothetical protein